MLGFGSSNDFNNALEELMFRSSAESIITNLGKLSKVDWFKKLSKFLIWSIEIFFFNL